MRRRIAASALLGGAMVFGLWAPVFAAGAGPSPSLQLVGGYKYCDYNGCYYCQRRECDDYSYNYGKKYCKHYTYYDCAPYGGGGGGGY